MNRRMLANGLTLSLVLTWVAPMAVAADSTPSDIEMHSAYCIPVARFWVQQNQRYVDQAIKSSATNSKSSRDMIENWRKRLAYYQDLLDRFSSQVDLHVPVSEGSPLITERYHGEQDLLEWRSAVDACSRKCSSADGPRDTCADTCMDKELVARIKSCDAPDWLPNPK
jgi:hypothetical protein